LATALALLALLALVGDASYSIYGITVLLPRTAENLEAASAALAGGDVRSARSDLTDAVDDAKEATRLTHRPAFTLLRATPDGRYVGSLVEAAALTAQAGRTGLKAAEQLGGNSEDIATSLFSDGQLDLDAIEESQGPVSEAARLLRRATSLLEGGEEPWVDAVSEAGADAETRIANAAGSVATAEKMLSVLPGMFGADEPRRYLLGFQALGEARATGGLIGFTGALEASDGAIELVDVQRILRSIPTEFDEPVEAPEWFATNYGPQSALTQPQQVNTSPNFPVVADVMLEMFESQTGQSYDGMVLMDPVALEHLIPATGDIVVSGWDEPITPENVVDVMLRDSYLELSTEEQNQFLSEVVQNFWDRIAEGEFDAAALATGLSDATASQHFRVHAVAPTEAQAMAAANVDGDYTQHDPNVQIAFHNNYSANKVDYFLRRDITTTIKLEPDAAQVRTTFTMTNQAPAGPPSLLLGPSSAFAPGDPPGTNRMLFNVLLPLGAEDISFGSGPTRTDPVLYEDDGHLVPWTIVEIPQGEQITIHLSYRIRNPYELEDDGTYFRFTNYPQPASTADTFSIAVTAPEGHGLLANGDQSSDDDALRDQVLRKGNLDEPATIELRLVPEAR
jgi:hypothetical protein